MRRARRAFALVEVSLALLVAATVVLAIAQLIQSNLAGARKDQRRAAATLLVAALLEVLQEQPPAQLRQMATSGSVTDLDQWVRDRASRLPEAFQHRYLDHALALLESIRFEYAEDVGGHRGLARIHLSLQQKDGIRVDLRRLYRVGVAVPAPPETPATKDGSVPTDLSDAPEEET